MGKTLLLYSNERQLVTALRENNEAAIRYVFDGKAYGEKIKQLYHDIIVEHRCRLKLNDLRDSFKLKMLHNNCEAMAAYEDDSSCFEVWLMVKAEKYFNACGREHDKEMVENIACTDENRRILREKDTEYVFNGKEYKSLFNILYYKYVNSKSSNHQMDIDEMVHEIYCHLVKEDHKRLKKYDSGRDFFDRWLFTTGKNFLINYFTKKNEELLDSDDLSTVDNEGKNPYRDADMVNDVGNALPKLPTNYQDVIKKIFYEDKNPEEVAKEMGISRGNVDTLKYRALAKLSQLLIAYSDEFSGANGKNRIKKKNI